MAESESGGWQAVSPQTSVLGSVIHDFSARSPSHLSLQLGDTVHILEECGGWYRGTLLKKRLTGIFPASFVHLRTAAPLSLGSKDSPHPVDPFDRELSVVLPQWKHLLLNKYYVERHENFSKLHDAVMEVLSIRRQLQASALSLDEQRKLRHRAAYLIDWGNKTMGLPLTPRNDDKEVIDERSVSLVDLFRMHHQSAQEVVKGDAVRKVSMTTSANRRGTDVTEKLHHLYFRLCNFEGIVQGECELHVSLYDVRDDMFFSERYVVKYDKSGEPTSYGGADNIRCIFSDLSTFDLQRKEAYLVFHVIRIGDMMLDPHVSKDTNLYRRPYACAVFPIEGMLLKHLVPQSEAEVHTCELFQCSSEHDYCTMHLSLVKKQTGSFKSLLSRVHFSLQPFHGLLSTVREVYPYLFQKSIPVCRKLGFPEVMMPGDTRNDIYVSLLSGDFKGKDNKKAEKNMECVVSVILNDGSTLKDCISPGTSLDNITSYKSLVVYHTNAPQWGETIKLDIPLEKFPNAHVRFCSFHRSTNKKGFSSFMLAFLPLVHTKGMALADDDYNLIVYKCDSSILTHLDPNQYLHLPWNGSEEAAPQAMLPRTMTSSKILRMKARTVICSTKLTQNYNLMIFLNWRQRPDQLRECLQGLMVVSGYEVVKFLQDTLDALFSILSEHSEQCGQLVFQCLVYIIKLLNETKFENFRSVLDSYIVTHFNGVELYQNLIHELRQCLHTARASFDQKCIKTVQSLQYIFRFIVTSRLLQSSGGAKEQDDASFRNDLISVFDSFVAILEQDKSSSKSSNTALQASLLQSFPTIFQEVLQVLEPADFSRVIQRILDCVPSNRLNNQKLICISRIVSNDLWHHESARTILLPTLSYHLKSLMQQGELEAAKCLDIHGDILRVLKRNDVGAVSGNITVIAKSFLLTYMRFVGQRGKSTQTATAATLFSSLLDLMTESHYRQFVEAYEDWQKAEEFLTECFGAFCKFLTKSPFAEDWTSMHVTVASVFLRAAKSLSAPMQEQLHQNGKFSVKLWASLFELYGDLACGPALQFENLSTAQHNDYLTKYGDIRVEASKEVVSLWKQLGMKRKMSFIPSLCGSFLKISLLKQREVRKLVIPLFIDMISCELAVTGDFQQMVSELVDKLDDLVSVQEMGDNEYKEHMHTIMEECCQQDVALRQADGMEFVDYCTTLLERLLDLRNIPDGDGPIIQRMQAIVNLMQYYKQMQREAMYIRYIYRLAKLHLIAHNYAEAAFTLLRHAKILKWEDTPLVDKQCDFPDLPTAKTELELKINLYRMIIDFFDKAKVYEEAIPLCKELAEQYEHVTYQYRDLIPIYRRIADLFGKIVDEVRPVSEFFRVGFYGTKAPSFMKGKQFIFRGREFEHVSDFTHCLLESFPTASILKFNTEPNAEYEYKEGMFIQIAKVEANSPPNKLLQAAMSGSQLPALHVDSFTLNRPIQKGGKEFTNMWIERTVYATEMTLPGILHWVPVNHRHTVEISPLSNAVESMVTKNKEIRERTIGAEKNSEQLNPLSMILNGVIDAAVMGGLAVYEEAFLTREYLAAHPDEEGSVQKLKDLIKEQVSVLGEGLAVHSQIAPADVRPLHDKMEQGYLDMQQKFYPESIPARPRAATMSHSPSPSLTSLEQQKPVNGTDGLSLAVVSPSTGRRSTFSVLPGAAAVKAKKKSNPAPAGAGLAMMSLMILGHADVTEAEQAGTKSKATGNRANGQDAKGAAKPHAGVLHGVHLTAGAKAANGADSKSSSRARSVSPSVSSNGSPGRSVSPVSFDRKPVKILSKKDRSMSLTAASGVKTLMDFRDDFKDGGLSLPVPARKGNSLPNVNQPPVSSFVAKEEAFTAQRPSKLCRSRHQIIAANANHSAPRNLSSPEAVSPTSIKSSPRFTRTSKRRRSSCSSIDKFQEVVEGKEQERPVTEKQDVPVTENQKSPVAKNQDIAVAENQKSPVAENQKFRLIGKQNRNFSSLSLGSGPSGNPTPTSSPLTPRSSRVSSGSVPLRPFRRIFTHGGLGTDITPPTTPGLTRPASFHESMSIGIGVASSASSISPASSDNSVLVDTSPHLSMEDDFAPSLFCGARSSNDAANSPTAASQPSQSRMPRQVMRRRSSEHSIISKDTAL